MFTCWLCEEEQDLTEIHETYGLNAPDHLCKSCYATVSAQLWDIAVKDIEDEHKYDHL